MMMMMMIVNSEDLIKIHKSTQNDM